MIEEMRIGGKPCFLCHHGKGGPLLIQPVDDHDREGLEEEFQQILSRTGSRSVTLAAFSVSDWNQDLSPWPAEAVFGNQPFGAGAADTLHFVTGSLIPALRSRLEEDFPVFFLGGYSLAGLFALWAGYMSNCFHGIAAASPSVWFPGWMKFAARRSMQAEDVYLSLGDREEKARNPVMAQVGECIRQQAALLQKDAHAANTVLEWNEGNHFRDPALRTAKAFAWVINQWAQGTAEQKRRLRLSMAERAAALSPANKQAANEKITEALLQSSLYRQSQVIFTYVSMPGEPDTRRLIAQALTDGKRVCVPKCLDGGVMRAVPIRGLEELRPGAWRIPEPPTAPDPDSEPAPDLILAPCVTVSSDGKRLGRGRGYYDRYLARTAAPAVCLCYGQLLTEDIPVVPEDVRVAFIATENGLFDCR